MSENWACTRSVRKLSPRRLARSAGGRDGRRPDAARDQRAVHEEPADPVEHLPADGHSPTVCGEPPADRGRVRLWAPAGPPTVGCEGNVDAARPDHAPPP